MKKLIKINIFVLILVSSAFLLSCTALEYGANLNTHRDRLIDVKTLEGMKQLDLEQRQYLQIKRYVESNGVPDYIYKDGQFSIYVIYSKLPKVVHFSMGLSGGCTIDIKDNIPKDWQYQIDASNPKEKLDSSKNIVPIVTTPSPTSGLKESELKDKVFPIKKAIDELDVIQITNVVNLMVPGAYWVPFPVEIDPCILSLTRTTEGWKYYSAPQVNGRASFLLLSVISQGDTIGIRVSVANPNDREWYVDNTKDSSIAFLQLGGGIAADFPICVVPHLKHDYLADESMEIKDQTIRPWAAFIEIHSSPMSFGSYSGAGWKEKITWDKLPTD
ncbi:MAG: hypothetical protein WCR55_14740, partial [Lentisphaerota bacterium]